jgi:hypothetical protein
MTIDITTLNGEDIIDVRDIIERIEELESDRDDYMGEAAFTDPTWASKEPEAFAELAQLTAIMEDMKGYGGDEQWRGDWYPVTLIRESYFTDYCQELCEDIGAVPRDFPVYIEIDWEATARNFMVDYSTVEIDGVTYFYR